MFQNSPAPVIPLEKVEALRRSMADLFLVGDTTLDVPHPGYVRFRGRFLQDPAHCFERLRQGFEAQGFTPLIREVEGRTAVIALPLVIEATDSNPTINFVLFIATIFSTMMVGGYEAIATAQSVPELVRGFLSGWPFSLCIMLILTAHELGHYFAARYHKVPVTLPYFIPLPFPAISFIGTLGAFIRLKGPAQNRRVLLDIGAAGPLAGLVFAIPILFYGLSTSALAPLPTAPYLLEGNSLFYLFAKFVVFGQVLPANGLDVTLNQVAWAGWVGLLVTSLNLIPAGQLDGGHMAYVLFGEKARQFFWPIVIGLGLLALFTLTFTWVIWIVLLYYVGRRHAEPLDDVTRLDPVRRGIAIFGLVLFVLTFTPIPLQIIFP